MPPIPPFLFRIAIAIVGLAAPVLAQAQTIRNTATLTYSAPDGDRTVASNTVLLNTSSSIKRPTKISFRQLPDGYALEGLACQADPIKFTPALVSEAELAAAPALQSLDVQDPVLIVLEAVGENLDPTTREVATLNVSVDEYQGSLSLTETGPNTGVFAGGLPPANSTPGFEACDLPLEREDTFRLSFQDTVHSTGSASSLLVDPEGFVFDSRTGELLNGATVTLIDDATGLPAASVFGEDGVSRYPNSVVTGSTVVDSSGDDYVFSKGDFRFPLAPVGRYHFLITPPPGYTAASTVVAAELAKLPGVNGDPFDITDASYGGGFVLAGMAPVRIDIPLDPQATNAGAMILEKTASVREAGPGDLVQYRVELRNAGGAAIAVPTITDTLPSGLRYRAGSTRGAAEPAASGDGRTLRFAPGAVAAGDSAHLSYLVEVVPGAPLGEAVNRAVASAPRLPISNEASASIRIRPLLNTDALTLIGRVTAGACGDPERRRKGVAGVRLLLEDGTSVVTDRDGLYHFEGVRPGTHVVQIDTGSVSAAYAPVACDSDTRAARSAISRFLEGGGGSLQRVDFQLRPTGKKVDAADALPVVAVSDTEAAGQRSDWLEQATPGADWLFPGADHNPRAPAVRVVIAHAPTSRVALRLNGELVDLLAFDGTDTDPARGVAVSKWNGLPLADGDNVLEAKVLDAAGAVVTTLTRTVHYSNAAAHATYVPEMSRLIADGLTRPLIALRVTDRDARPVRAGSIVSFHVDQPYLAAQEVAAEQGRQLAGLERADPTAVVVDDNGLAFAALDPTRQSGAAHVVVTIDDHGVTQKTEILAWLVAPAQNWVVVGYGRGTIGYDRLSRAKSLPRAARHDVVTDGQIALYAKGRIKGSWLLTLAYDSDRREDRDRGLLGTIDPDRYYTVYGDGTRQSYDAPTERKLYLRLERREYYALYGDFESGLVDTQLTRYRRTMNGVKTEYSSNIVRFTAFAANDDSRYGRDEIQGNGLSGPYRLSARDIVPNSDKLRLETRDRFRSEKIVESKQLTRHIDYDIDPTAGTIRFREPILSRDPDLNPVFIVVDYETEGRGRKLAAGGRAAVTLGRVVAGASVLHDQSMSNATVAGIDAKLRLGANTVLRAEAATGGRGGIREGQAYLAEIEHHGSSVDMLTYFHRQDRDFGVGQQNLGEAATQKIGLDGRLRLGSQFSVTGTGWLQDNLEDSGRRVAGEARLEYRRKANGLIFAGVQFASDRAPGGADRDSRLLTLGATQSFFDDRLEVRAQGQIAPGGDDASVDFPARQQIGVSWRFSKSVRLLAEHEIGVGQRYTAQTSRIGFDIAPWAGAHLLTTLNQGAIGENGTRTFAQYGLSQSLPIGKRWTLDGTVDSSSTLRGNIPSNDILNRYQPVSTGGVLSRNGQDGLDGDFVAATLGATYRAGRWSWNGRGEFRSSDRETRWGLTTNFLRSLGEGSTFASSAHFDRSRDERGAIVSSAEGDVALALRPLDSRWAVLERFELRNERADAGAIGTNALAIPVFADGVQTTFRAINNLAVNYRSGPEGSGHGLEATLYYGAKYVRGRYANEALHGFIDVIGLEVRKDINRRIDIGANASVQHSWTSGTAAFAYGPSIGVSPAENLWISAGYNVSGFRDRDFEDARWTRAGPYLTLRLKLDQLFLGRAGRALLGSGR